MEVAADQPNPISDEYKLVLNNVNDCTIEFSPPHEHLSYADNMSLKPGEYDIHISKHMHSPLSLHIRLKSDLTHDVELKSIFTNYGGGHIDKLITDGEIGLEEEFGGETLLHQLIMNFSKEYPSFSSFGRTNYKGLPDGAPIDDLLNSITYFTDKGFNINKPDSNGKNLLSNVIKVAPTEVVSLLFQNGAKIQPEFINEGNDYAGIDSHMGGFGAKWNEKVLHLFPADLLTELLNREVESFFSADGRLVKLLVQGGAYPLPAFDIYDKKIKAKINSRIMLISGEREAHGYLKWATENYAEIKPWKEKQQISFKLNHGEFADIKDYTDSHPDSLQHITDGKLKVFLVGPKGLTVKAIADRIAQGAKEDELVNLIASNEDEYADSFSSEQKQYMLGAGLTPRLVSFLEERTRQVKIIKEERAMLAMLKQEEERRAAEAAARTAEAERQAQSRMASKKKKQKGELFGKGLALIAGAVIANSSPLDSVKKTEFLTNYATDVLTNNKSMSNTQQWANGAGQQSAQTTSGGGSNEVSRNKQISSSCKQQSHSYDDGDAQTTSHCQLAIYNQCVADEMCSLYPGKCGALRARVTTSCNMMSGVGFNSCPACK